jgi:transglutaminase-like putative cysteine protease
VSGTTRLPLQHGNGNYTVYVLKNVSGSQYKIVQSQKISLNMESLKDVYLQSIQMIQWNQENLAIEKAKELTQNATSAQEKVALIYDYIYSNINYDNQKESQLTST